MTPQQQRGPIDLGLQLERTTLAWRRTTLTTVVAAAAAARLLATDHPTWQAIAVGLALLTAGLAAFATARRFRVASVAMAHHVDRERGVLDPRHPAHLSPPPLPGGGTLAIVAIGQAGAGLLTVLLLL